MRASCRGRGSPCHGSSDTSARGRRHQRGVRHCGGEEEAWDARVEENEKALLLSTKKLKKRDGGGSSEGKMAKEDFLTTPKKVQSVDPRQPTRNPAPSSIPATLQEPASGK